MSERKGEPIILSERKKGKKIWFIQNQWVSFLFYVSLFSSFKKEHRDVEETRGGERLDGVLVTQYIYICVYNLTILFTLIYPVPGVLCRYRYTIHLRRLWAD